MQHTTLEKLAEAHDAFLIDQFGVLLTGSGAYPGAAEALAWLAAQGKQVLLLSNSGKRADANAARLTRLGFARDSYLMVLSSGEVAYRLLARRGLPAGTRVWLHSRDDDQSAIAGLGLECVDSPDTADLLLLAASQADIRTLAEYKALLSLPARRAVPMLCTNPDEQMLTDQGLRPGAGAIAQLYQCLGGTVEWVGKPYPLIYAEASSMLGAVPAEKVLCVGDSPAHDIAGGAGQGFRTALVRTGLYAAIPASQLSALCVTQAGTLPNHVLPRFNLSACPS